MRRKQRVEIHTEVRSGDEGSWQGCGRVSSEGHGDEGFSVEEVKELCPGCWELSKWVVTVTGGEQRKKLGLELKPLINGRK